MRVGVTGSSGLIGTAVVSALRERGDHVVRFLRPDSPQRDADVVRWDPVRGDVDENDLRRAGGFDAVVNLAGAGIGDRRWSATRKEEIRRSRIDATSLLVELLERSSGTSYLASGSAIGFYGSRDDEVLDESSSCGNDFLAHLCREWEEAATPLTRSGTVVALIRTGLVMSARGGALKRQLPLFRVGLGGRLGSGRQWMSAISLRDQVRAVLWLVEARPGGPHNLVAPNAVTNREFTRVLARALRRPALVPVPAVALRLVLGHELATGAALASQRVVPNALLEGGFRFDDDAIASVLSSALS